MGEAKRKAEQAGAAIDRCPPAKSIFLAMPCYTGQMAAETASSLLGAGRILDKVGADWDWEIEIGCCYIDLVRNRIVRRFLESKHTDLIFIDSDVSFDPESILRLAVAPRPVVGGLYLKKQDAVEFTARFDGPTVTVDSDGLIDSARFAPTGFLKINRKVFEAMDVPEYADYSGERTKAYFNIEIGATYVGEDVSFCQRWRRMGGKVYIVADMTLGHTGWKTWEGNWLEWQKQQAKANSSSAAAPPAPNTSAPVAERNGEAS